MMLFDIPNNIDDKKVIVLTVMMIMMMVMMIMMMVMMIAILRSCGGGYRATLIESESWLLD